MQKGIPRAELIWVLAYVSQLWADTLLPKLRKTFEVILPIANAFTGGAENMIACGHGTAAGVSAEFKSRQTQYLQPLGTEQ